MTPPEKQGIYVLRPDPARSHQRRYSGRRAARDVVPATLFVPQDTTLSPEVHFPLQTVFAPDRPAVPRFINRFDSREMLLVIDGSCINNGRHASKTAAPRAGCSFLYKTAVPPPLTTSCVGNTAAVPDYTTDVTFPFLHLADINNDDGDAIAFRLERQGPDGSRTEHSSNRAKLRAVIAALQFRQWHSEGWRRVVILTDLEYIVDGATAWLPRWVARRWIKPRRQGRYKNRDLWEELQGRVDELRLRGCAVSFWLVGGRDAVESSRFIAMAKGAAREAAHAMPEIEVERFTRLCGIML